MCLRENEREREMGQRVEDMCVYVFEREGTERGE